MYNQVDFKEKFICFENQNKNSQLDICTYLYMKTNRIKMSIVVTSNLTFLSLEMMSR